MARSPFVSVDTVRLSLKDGDWIEVKERLSFGEQNALTAATLRQSGSLLNAREGGLPDVTLDMASYAVMRLLAWVVDWSFVGPDGKSVPVTRELVEALDPTVAAELTAALDAHVAATTADPTSATVTP